MDGVARRAALAIVLALGGAAVVAGAAGPAGAQTLIRSCPYEIVRPGTYELARNLTCPAGAPAITVAADNVRLDLNGRTLTGARDPAGGGIIARGVEDPATGELTDPITGLRVEDGTVRNFGDGLSIEGAPGARVRDVTVSGSAANGILVRNSPGVRLEGNTVTGGAGDGISLAADADRGQIRDNTVTGNAADGIQLAAGATGNRLEGNRATGNGTLAGVDLLDGNLGRNPPRCVNAWSGNRFATDNEGDGPGAGCIR